MLHAPGVPSRFVVRFQVFYPFVPVSLIPCHKMREGGIDLQTYMPASQSTGALMGEGEEMIAPALTSQIRTRRKGIDAQGLPGLSEKNGGANALTAAHALDPGFVVHVGETFSNRGAGVPALSVEASRLKHEQGVQILDRCEAKHAGWRRHGD